MCYQEAKFSNQMAECEPGQHHCEVQGGAAVEPQVGEAATVRGWQWGHWKEGLMYKYIQEGGGRERLKQQGEESAFEMLGEAELQPRTGCAPTPILIFPDSLAFSLSS